VAVSSAQHGDTTGGAAVSMEAGGGSRWKPKVGVDGSRRWETMEAGGGSRWKDKNGPSDEMGRKPRRLQHKLFFLNFKQDFRFKNQSFEILLN
jgi:hypothetical protein